MDSGGGNTGSSDPAKTSTVETATNSLPGCGCSSANNITVRVTPTTGGQFDLQVAKTESVENFKKLISKKLKVPKERICLLHRDRQLRDGTLQENQLMDGSRLTLLPSVETGLLAQRPEQSVMQALESLNDTQVNDFLSGKAPLNLTMRLGDHMMLIQLQLSTVTPSSSRRSSGGSSNSSSTTAASASSTSSSAPTPATAAAASPAPSPSASPSKSSLPSQLALASPSLSSVIASSPSLSSVIAAAAAAAAASASASASAASSSSSSAGSSSGGSSSNSSSSSGLSDPTMTNSRTALPPSIPSSSGFAKAAAVAAAAAAASPSPSASPARPSSYTTATTTSAAECASGPHPASPSPCPSAAATSTSSASPHPSPLKFLEEAASLLPKATSSTVCPATATTSATSSPSFTSSSSSSSQSSSSAPHTAQPSSSSATTTSPASSSATASSSAAATGSSTHACAYGSGGSGCKCEAPAAKPMLDTRALAEASRNLTQTLKQLSSEVLTSRSDTAEDSPRGGRRQGAIIESMHHHGKGVYSGTFSGTLNPALQDRYGRPKRDISTIIHILNDLLCATPQYRRHTRQGHSISVEATGSTVPKKGTNPSDKNSSNLEYMEESGSLSRENQATRGKMEHLRLIMEERRARRRARREARAAPYTTQWSAKSESLPQSSAMGHDTVEPMETGEQSSSAASSEQQLCELNPPEPVVA